MDLFIVDHGIESTDNFREKRSSWVLNEPKIFFKGRRQMVGARYSLTDKILERIHLCYSTVRIVLRQPSQYSRLQP